jgi:hypothetical protein
MAGNGKSETYRASGSETSTEADRPVFDLAQTWM